MDFGIDILKNDVFDINTIQEEFDLLVKAYSSFRSNDTFDDQYTLDEIIENIDIPRLENILSFVEAEGINTPYIFNKRNTKNTILFTMLLGKKEFGGTKLYDLLMEAAKYHDCGRIYSDDNCCYSTIVERDSAIKFYNLIKDNNNYSPLELALIYSTICYRKKNYNFSEEFKRIYLNIVNGIEPDRTYEGFNEIVYSDSEFYSALHDINNTNGIDITNILEVAHKMAICLCDSKVLSKIPYLGLENNENISDESKKYISFSTSLSNMHSIIDLHKLIEYGLDEKEIIELISENNISNYRQLMHIIRYNSIDDFLSFLKDKQKYAVVKKAFKFDSDYTPLTVSNMIDERIRIFSAFCNYAVGIDKENFIKLKQEYDECSDSVFTQDEVFDENFSRYIDVAIKIYNIYCVRKNYTDLKTLENSILNYMSDFNFDMKDDIIGKYKSIMSSYEDGTVYNLSEQFISDFIKQINDIFLKHWEISTTDVNLYKAGAPFKFLCHSTRTSNWGNDSFSTKYISTSYITEEINDLFKEGFGFIFEPKNIVCANYSDLSCNNRADNDDDVLAFRNKLFILHPNEILERLISKKKMDVSRKVYSEVILDSFNPSAVFCKSIGGKKYDPNYRGALKINESFGLPLVDIDITSYSPDVTLGNETFISDNKKEFIRNLIMAITNETVSNCDEEYLEVSYENFWNEFLSMKKEKQYNYTDDDIFSLFKRNYDLVNGNIDLKKLFSSQYTEEEIYSYLVGSCNLLSCYNGQQLDKLFENISSMSSYVLGKEYNGKLIGLPELCQLSDFKNQVDLNSIRNKIREQNINSIIGLVSVIATEVLHSKNNFVGDLDTLLCRKKYLEVSIEESEKKIRQYEECCSIEQMQFDHSLTTIKIDSLKSQISFIDDTIDYYKKQDIDMKSRLAKKQEEKCIIEQQNLKLSNQLKKLLEVRTRIQEQIYSYKFKMFHRKEIERLRKKMSVIDDRCTHIYSSIEKNTKDIIVLNVPVSINEADTDYYNGQIYSLVEEKKQKEEEISNLVSEFKQKTGIDYEQYPELLKKAKKIIEDKSGGLYLSEKMELQHEYDELCSKIINVQEQLSSLQTIDLESMRKK